MQDIDFDEIDRAVSSTMGGERELDVPERSEPAPASRPTPPAARRSSGRFMDVVHPSSDMRSSAPSRPESREEAPEPTHFTRETSDMPDPLDFHGFKDEPEKPAEEAPEEAVATPLESPFLADAKVEKRPLGAFSDYATQPSDDEKEPDTPEVETPVVKPEEAEEEPLLLEAPDVELLEATSEPEPAPVVEAEKAPEATPAPAPTAEVPDTLPTSIAQQYKEQPSTTDQPSGAIYDTEAYHQPLTHAPKKRSGAFVILWIVALIALGAGAGFAVYAFVLPLL